MSLLNFFSRHKTFTHGVHPDENKSGTAGMPIKRLTFAPEIALPLAQHRGAPSKPIVTVGQEVVRGEPIAEANGYVSVPLHSPVTGVVTSVDALVATIEGPKTRGITIKTHAASSQKVRYHAPVDADSLSPESLMKAVQESGMVGLGGAAFPSHVKLLPHQGKRIHTVIVNGCECEPYLTCDHRVMLEQTDQLLQGIRMIMRATGAEKAIIGIENNKRDAVAAIRSKLLKNDFISVKTVQTKYPQGAEKILITSLLGVEVPSGGLPADIGLAVYNVGTLAQLGDLIPDSRGLIERVVTVSGPGITKPGNYLVPIGTPLRYLMQKVGDKDESNLVIVGGPMMGMSAASLDAVITKGVSGVLVFEHTETETKDQQLYPCIGCGECLKACPLNLNPCMLGKLAAVRAYEQMESEYNLIDCFECGCCSYVCPANIPLTQYFRISKAVNREVKSAA